MSDLIDPVKARAYGIKRPFDEKVERVAALHEEGKRYYPGDRKTGVDEWGAVIKHQSEMYEKSI